MLELLVVVGSLALADSINPSTVVPALYLATHPHARPHLAGFVVGVLAVSLAGGLAVALGAGQLLLDAVPRPSPATGHTLELVGGVGALVAAAVLWRLRDHAISEPRSRTNGRSSLLLGVSIMAVELPTALPYFAAIAVIVGSGRSVAAQVVLLVEYNVLFVSPLLAILGAHVVAPHRTERVLVPIGAWLRTHALSALAVLATIAGVVLLGLGVHGLAA